MDHDWLLAEAGSGLLSGHLRGSAGAGCMGHYHSLSCGRLSSWHLRPLVSQMSEERAPALHLAWAVLKGRFVSLTQFNQNYICWTGSKTYISSPNQIRPQVHPVNYRTALIISLSANDSQSVSVVKTTNGLGSFVKPEPYCIAFLVLWLSQNLKALTAWQKTQYSKSCSHGSSWLAIWHRARTVKPPNICTACPGHAVIQHTVKHGPSKIEHRSRFSIYSFWVFGSLPGFFGWLSSVTGLSCGISLLIELLGIPVGKWSLRQREIKMDKGGIKGDKMMIWISPALDCRIYMDL